MYRLILALVLALPIVAHGQENFEAGSYWTITAVDTKPTRFDDYVGDISGLWKSQMELLMEDGKVLGYKMLSNVHARDGEPDLWLMTEWTSAAAALDTPYSYYEEMMTEMVGSMDEVDEMAMDREELRTIMSEVLAREITFRDDSED